MVFNKYIINDTLIIDDSTEKYICIYFTTYIDNKYLPKSIYINRYNGKIKEIFDINTYGIEWTNYKICLNYKKINIKELNIFFKYFYNNYIKENNSIDIKKLNNNTNLFSITIPIAQQIT
jgi:hypothetical protein